MLDGKRVQIKVSSSECDRGADGEVGREGLWTVGPARMTDQQRV